MGRSLAWGGMCGHREGRAPAGPQARELSGPGVSRLVLFLMCSVVFSLSRLRLLTPRPTPVSTRPHLLLQPHSPRQWRPQPWGHTSAAEASSPDSGLPGRGIFLAQLLLCVLAWPRGLSPLGTHTATGVLACGREHRCPRRADSGLGGDFTHSPWRSVS